MKAGTLVRIACPAALALMVASAEGQIVISFGSFSGVSGGSATPAGGGASTAATQTNTPFTVNASGTSGSGGTSGGLGSAGVIGSSALQADVTSAQARSPGAFSLTVHMFGAASFDTVNYTGTISSSALLDTLFFSIGGSGPMRFTMFGTGDWAFLPAPGTLQPLGGSGGSINGDMLTPGSYVLSLPAALVRAGTLPPNVPSFDGGFVILVPGAGTVVPLLMAAPIVTRRRRLARATAPAIVAR